MQKEYIEFCKARAAEGFINCELLSATEYKQAQDAGLDADALRRLYCDMHACPEQSFHELLTDYVERESIK